MKKLILSLVFISMFTLFLGCESAIVIENDTPVVAVFEDTTLGISFEYTDSDEWTAPTVIDALNDVRSYSLLKDADYSLYTKDKLYVRPTYDWAVKLSENMENAKIDPPNCEGDACAIVCGEDPCIEATLNGYDYSDLDALKSVVSENEPSGEEALISDYEVGGNRVLTIAHNGPGQTLDVYISNGSKTIVMLVYFGFNYDNETITYTIREEVQKLIDQVAGSLKFL